LSINAAIAEEWMVVIQQHCLNMIWPILDFRSMFIARPRTQLQPAPPTKGHSGCRTTSPIVVFVMQPCPIFKFQTFVQFNQSFITETGVSEEQESISNLRSTLTYLIAGMSIRNAKKRGVLRPTATSARPLKLKSWAASVCVVNGAKRTPRIATHQKHG